MHLALWPKHFLFCYIHSAPPKSLSEAINVTLVGVTHINHGGPPSTSLLRLHPCCDSPPPLSGLHLPMLTRTVNNSVWGSQCKGKTATAFHHTFFCHITATALYWESFQWGSWSFPISGLHLCLHMGIDSAQHVYHLSRIICKYSISPVVKRPVLVEHGQKQPNTYSLDPEDNEEEP